MDNLYTKEIAKCGLMAALTFIFTYTFKIPSPNGYTHLGDCFVLLGVLVLGRKKGALAGGIGAALSDLLGGYMVWVLPTFFIKAIMAYVMGTIVEKVMPENKFNYIIGACIGGVIQIVLYTLVKVPLFGAVYAVTRMPGLTIQTISGIVLTVIIVSVLDKAHVLKFVKEM